MLKKLFLLKTTIVIITLLICTGCMAKQVEGPAIKFKKDKYNFGQIKEGKEIEYIFTFKNIGSEKVRIEDVKPTCGCTVADEWSREIEPGAKGKIPITFRSKGFQGHIAKTIKVLTNIPDQETINLYIEGNVNVDIEIRPKNIHLGEVKKDTLELNGDVSIKNHLSKDLYINDIVLENENTKAQLIDINPGKEYKLHITVKPPFKDDHVKENIILKTDNQDIPSIEIEYIYYKPPIIRVYPEEINIPENNPNEMEIRIIVRSQLDVPISIENVNFLDAKFEYEILEIEEGSHLHLKFIIPEGYSIPEEKNVAVTFQLMNAPGNPVYNVPIKEINP